MERFEEIAWLVLVPATLLQALVVALVVIGR
jgi:NADH-quinone oxidoreductase subunit H